MAAGKTLIGGTAYTIKGGKALINGTAYKINKGKTLIGGTGYTIYLKEQTLRALFESASIKYIDGRDANSNGTTYVSPTTAGTYWAFVFYAGYVGITKLVSTGSAVTKTLLKQTGTYSYGQVYVNGVNCYCSENGTSASSRRGQTIALLQFDGYTEAQVDALLSVCTLTHVIGRNATTSRAVSADASNLSGKIALIAENACIGVSYVGTDNSISNLVGNSSTNPSLLYLNKTAFYVSTNGTSAGSFYGASMATIA